MSGLFDGRQIKDASIGKEKIDATFFEEIPIASSDEVLTNDTAGLKANLSLEVDGSYAVLKGKNGAEIGRVNVAIGAIQDASYDTTTNEIVIEVITSTGTDEIRIPADDLIDIYHGSAYIDIDEDNVISVKYNDLKDALINDDFVQKTDLEDYYTKTEADDKYIAKDEG